ncbi:hypothetical protein N9043_00145 [bacterium]|nr:hypothetical protein [bacterium]
MELTEGRVKSVSEKDLFENTLYKKWHTLTDLSSGAGYGVKDGFIVSSYRSNLSRIFLVADSLQYNESLYINFDDEYKYVNHRHTHWGHWDRLYGDWINVLQDNEDKLVCVYNWGDIVPDSGGCGDLGDYEYVRYEKSLYNKHPQVMDMLHDWVDGKIAELKGIEAKAALEASIKADELALKQKAIVDSFSYIRDMNNMAHHSLRSPAKEEKYESPLFNRLLELYDEVVKLEKSKGVNTFQSIWGDLIEGVKKVADSDNAKDILNSASAISGMQAAIDDAESRLKVSKPSVDHEVIFEVMNMRLKS